MADLSKLSRGQLVRMVEVLRVAADYLSVATVGTHSASVALKAAEEASRISAEPVEPSIDDLVRVWTTGAPDAWVFVHPDKGDIRLGDLDGYQEFATVADAIAWALAQQGEVAHV